ncbi:MAG: SPOR domain-containing protein [Desulfobacterales bacterium]|nr:SPOR domain-containing protein [Desulfobacterales bacterium]
MRKTEKPEKTPPKKRAASKAKKRNGITGWIALVFVASLWMFILGVFVGRGMAPVEFDIQGIQQELADLKAALLRQEQERFEKSNSEDNPEPPELGFYEALKDNKPIEVAESTLQEIGDSAPRHKTALTKKPEKIDKAISVPTPAISDKPLTIQVASVKTQGDAQRLVDKLKNKGYQAYSVSVDLQDKGTWYRIRVGSFASRSEAGSTVSKLKSDGIDAFVVTR